MKKERQKKMNEEHKKLYTDFSKHLKIKGYKKRGIEEKIRRVKEFLAYIEEEQIELRRLKVKDALPRNILSIEEMGKLLDGIEVKSRLDFKFKVVIEILYSTGCRISEIEKLRKKDIDLEEGYIKIIDDKESQDRRCCLTECALKLLKASIEIEG